MSSFPTHCKSARKPRSRKPKKADEYVRLARCGQSRETRLDQTAEQAVRQSEQEKIKASTIIQPAVRNGLTKVQVYRFPNTLCTDKGRGINQMEVGWGKTLTGIPKGIFELWPEYLRPWGYRIGYRVIDLPDGVPGDIGVTIFWSD